MSVKNKYALFAIIVFILTIFLSIAFGASQVTPPFPLLVSGIVTAISLFIVGQFMPRKTSKGTQMKEYLKGYEEFISRVEKSVIEKLFPPEKNT